MSGGYLTSSLLPSGGQSLINEVYAGVKEANPNMFDDGNKKDKISSAPPAYNPKIDITPHNPPQSQQGQQQGGGQGTSQRGIEMPFRDNYGHGGAPHGPPGQQSPTEQQLTPEEYNNLKKRFMWVLENSQSNREIFSNQATLDRALNDAALMISVINQFENTIQEQNRLAQQAQQAKEASRQADNVENTGQVESKEREERQERKGKKEDFIDSIDTRTTFQRIWEIIKLPLLLSIVFYFLISPNTVNQLLTYMPFLSNYEGFRMFFLSFAFFILAIITRQSISWLEN